MISSRLVSYMMPLEIYSLPFKMKINRNAAISKKIAYAALVSAFTWVAIGIKVSSKVEREVDVER
jgi:hypothetical protein